MSRPIANRDGSVVVQGGGASCTACTAVAWPYDLKEFPPPDDSCHDKEGNLRGVYPCKDYIKDKEGTVRYEIQGGGGSKSMRRRGKKSRRGCGHKKSRRKRKSKRKRKSRRI